MKEYPVMPPAARTLFEKRVLDSQKLLLFEGLNYTCKNWQVHNGLLNKRDAVPLDSQKLLLFEELNYTCKNWQVHKGLLNKRDAVPLDSQKLLLFEELNHACKSWQVHNGLLNKRDAVPNHTNPQGGNKWPHKDLN